MSLCEIKEGYRRCNKCRKIKKLSDFHRDKYGKHGRRYTCKECTSAFQRNSPSKRKKIYGMAICENPKCRKQFKMKRSNSSHCSPECSTLMSRERERKRLKREKRVLRWSEEEIKKLFLLREAYNKDFEEISKEFEGRTSLACHKKYWNMKQKEKKMLVLVTA